jgi:hypothetical protein
LIFTNFISGLRSYTCDDFVSSDTSDNKLEQLRERMKLVIKGKNESLESGGDCEGAEEVDIKPVTNGRRTSTRKSKQANQQNSKRKRTRYGSSLFSNQFS